MTREEFFYKYGCDCKDPNCSSVVKEKCSAEFFKDLDSVIENEKSLKMAEKGFIDNLKTYGELFTSEVIGKCVAEFEKKNGKMSPEGKAIVLELIEGRATMNPNPDFKVEDEFVERLKLVKDAMSANHIAVLVESYVQEHGTFSFKNGEIVRQILNEVQQNEN